MPKQSSTLDSQEPAKVHRELKDRDPDRVRSLTFQQDLDRIDEKTRSTIRHHYNLGYESITRRLVELDREWPVDLALMTGAGFFVWLGLILGAKVNRRFYGISGVAGAILLVFAFIGWVPPVLILRGFGIRTRGEINTERIALKALRGDFDLISEPEPNQETMINWAMKAAI